MKWEYVNVKEEEKEKEKVGKVGKEVKFVQAYQNEV